VSAFQFLTYVLQVSLRTVRQCTTQCLVYLSPKQFPSVVVFKQFKQLNTFHLKLVETFLVAFLIRRIIVNRLMSFPLLTYTIANVHSCINTWHILVPDWLPCTYCPNYIWLLYI